MTKVICEKCKEDTTHYAKGMCVSCYNTVLQKGKGKSPRVRASQNKYYKKYQKAMIILKNKHKKEFFKILSEMKNEETI